MFSLIITIISVALVAALALATLYYGGQAFNDGRAKAEASKIQLQGQQLLAASQLYRTQRGAWPDTLDDLVAEGFLKSIPVAQGPMASALAANAWTMPVPRVPVFALPMPSVDTCRKVNEKAYGLSGVLPQLHTSYVQQCFGESLSSLAVVTAYNADQLATAAANGAAGFTSDDVTSDAIPSPEDTAAWLVVPGEPAVAGPGPGTGTGGGGETGGGDSGGEPPDEPATPAAVGLSSSELSFANTATHTTEVRTLTITNTGGSVLTFSTPPYLSGSPYYSISGTTCGATLPAGQACDVTVQYAPTVVGASHTASLAVVTNAETSPNIAGVTGSAYNPVSLAAATLPAGEQGQAYGPFNFATLLNVSNEQAPDLGLVNWNRSGVLPTGMTFENGVLAGTPSQAVSNGSMTVSATYKNNQGQRVYVLTIAGGQYAFVQVSAGTNLSCGVTTSGVGKCWGAHLNSRLGLGVVQGADATAQKVSLPGDVHQLPSGVSRIAAGDQHACAIAGGTVYCWGTDAAGMVGNGPSLGNTSVAVSTGLSNALDVKVSHQHSCALVSGGGVACWGLNTNGQVGNGNTTNQQSPVSVAGLGTAATGLALTTTGTCASLDDGTVRCWGSSYGGTPVLVPGLSGVAQISGSHNGTARYCALLTDGTVRCWTPGGTPAAVAGVTGATEVAVGRQGGQVCAVYQNGSASCWSPTGAGPGLYFGGLTATVSSVSSGHDQTCVTLSNADAFCYGTNTYGQLGDGTLVSKSNIALPGKVGGAP